MFFKSRIFQIALTIITMLGYGYVAFSEPSLLIPGQTLDPVHDGLCSGPTDVACIIDFRGESSLSIGDIIKKNTGNNSILYLDQFGMLSEDGLFTRDHESGETSIEFYMSDTARGGYHNSLNLFGQSVPFSGSSMMVKKDEFGATTKSYVGVIEGSYYGIEDAAVSLGAVSTNNNLSNLILTPGAMSIDIREADNLGHLFLSADEFNIDISKNFGFRISDKDGFEFRGADSLLYYLPTIAPNPGDILGYVNPNELGWVPGDSGDDQSPSFWQAANDTDIYYDNGDNGYVGIGNKKPQYLLDVTKRALKLSKQDFYGSLNDLSVIGSFDGPDNADYRVWIDAKAGNPDRAYWEEYSSGLSGDFDIIPHESFPIAYGLELVFLNDTGHGDGDEWTFGSGYINQGGIINIGDALFIKDNFFATQISGRIFKSKSIFIGDGTRRDVNNIGNLGGNVFIGQFTGQDVTNVLSSNFIGEDVGSFANNASYSNFFGTNAGYGATNASNSIFIGNLAGNEDTVDNILYINYSSLSGNFSIGETVHSSDSGSGVIVSDDGSVLGIVTSNSFGFNIGVTIEDRLGATATIDSISGGGTSILIGQETSTGGYSNSISVGAYATNTASNQFMIGSSIRPINDIFINGTGSLFLPVGNDSQRTGYATDGAIRFNSDQGCLELYNGGWNCVGAGSNVLPAGSYGQVQYNNNGMFGASEYFAFDPSGANLSVFQQVPMVVSVNNSNVNNLTVSGAYNNQVKSYIIGILANAGQTKIDLSNISGYFTQNEQIVGQNSGATADLIYNTAPGYIDFAILTNISGNFHIGETIIGQSNGGTAIIDDSTVLGTDMFLLYEEGNYLHPSSGTITGSQQNLSSGISFRFMSATGNQVGDAWGIVPSGKGSVITGNVNALSEYQIRGNFFATQNNLGSVFLGRGASYNLDIENSFFVGNNAGYQATNASNSNFLGLYAGNGAVNASYSNFLGYYAGYQATNAANSIFIGKQAGQNDTVDNIVIPGSYSILLGPNTSTGGNSNSIAIGSHATNTKTNQFMIGSSTRPISEMAIVLDNIGGECVIDSSGANCSSDESLKSNITPLGSTLDTLHNIVPITYTWNSNNQPALGFSAQNVQQYYPELVKEGSQGYLVMNYANMTPILTRAIQELDLKIEAIESVASSVNSTFLDSLRGWLGDKLNGINKIFVKELCLTDGSEEECITIDELRQLKQSSGSYYQGESSDDSESQASDETEDISQESIDESTDSESEISVSESDLPVETSPDSQLENHDDQASQIDTKDSTDDLSDTPLTLSEETSQ